MAVWNRTASRPGPRRPGPSLATGACNISPFATPSASPRTTSSPRSARRGDSYDNALAESFNSLYKWELIYPQGPWRGLDDVEFATLGYVDWFNHRRLHGEITDDNTYVTPAEFEATYYRQDSTRPRGGYPITRAVMEPGAIQSAGPGPSHHASAFG